MSQKVYAITVCSNHVHIVVARQGGACRSLKSIGKSCGYSIGRFKKAATNELRKYGYNDKV